MDANLAASFQHSTSLGGVCDLDLAARRDQEQAETAEFSLLWEALTSGRQKIVETFFGEQTARFILLENQEQTPASLSPRYRRILQRAFLEADRKAVAAELRLAVSTVHAILKQCLEFFGLSCAPGQVPPLLLMAVRAASEPGARIGRWSRPRTRASTTLSVASAGRPEIALHPLLSHAEYEVIKCLMEGKSYAEIAELRGTAVRTVANQVAASFRELRVSGRSDLVRELVNQSGHSFDRLGSLRPWHLG